MLHRGDRIAPVFGNLISNEGLLLVHSTSQNIGEKRKYAKLVQRGTGDGHVEILAGAIGPSLRFSIV
jgi:hypothetical protein